MDTLSRLVAYIDRLNEIVGRAVAWLVLAVVGIVFLVVVLRYGFGWGRVAMQESYLWLHALVFMAAAGYTLRHDAHVRIDVIYARHGVRFRAWVDLLGSLLLLLPFTLTALVTAWPYVADSWARGEASREAAGLPALYLLKSAILVFAVLLMLQGLALAGRSLLTLLGKGEAERA
jgi:TRAP-type mannitol/chloroaromatic compound transport system permease small subunit